MSLPAAPVPERPVGRARPGWLVLALATLTAGLTGPGQTIGVSVFIDHLVVDLSLSRSQVGTAYLVGTLAGAALLPSVGRFVDRRGVRIAQIVVGVLFALALVNMSLVDGMIWLAIGFAGIRFLGQGSLTLVSTVTVQLRFVRSRGTALGIFTTATAGLMALVPVVLALVIDAIGWRGAWLVAAAAVLAVVVPVAWFGLVDLPRGGRRIAADPLRAPEPDDGSLDRGEAMRTSSFWLLAAVGGAAGMMSTALNFHQIDLLGEAGLSETAAAALFIPQVVGSTVAGLTIGYLADRIGTRYLPAVSMLLLLAAQLLAAVAAPGVVAVAYAVVLGSAGGAVRTAAATLQPQWFGMGHLGTIQGALTLFNVAASAIGPVVLTLAQEALGSYPPALVVLGVIPAAAMLFALGPNEGPTVPARRSSCGRLPTVQDELEPIRAADRVDAAWLTEVLHRAGIGAGHAVTEVTGRSIGTGQVGDNVRYRLTWSPGAPDLPETVVGKFPSQSDVSRATAVNLGTYTREIGFYRDLQGGVAIRTPDVLHVGWDAETHDFVVIMEDIRPAEQGDQLAGCSRREAELVVDQAVRLHAPTWGRTEELRRLDWLGFPDPERTQLMAGLVSALFPGFADRYAERLAPVDLELGAFLVERYTTWAARVAAWAYEHDAWCVVHGDYRLDNILFGTGADAPPVTVVDWQTVTVGTGPSDVAYFCGAGLPPSERAVHERALVERYVAGLAAAGVVIDVEAAWEGYVLGSAGGYVMAVIASQVVERTDRGDEMFAVMAERHAAQMRDLDLLGRL